MNYLRCRAKILTFGEERKKQINELYYNQGKTTREIAKVERMSIRDISVILKEEEARWQKNKQQGYLPRPTIYFLKVSAQFYLQRDKRQTMPILEIPVDEGKRYEYRASS